MKKGLKKALGLLVALSLMVVGSAFSALAADSPEQRQTFSVDLNNFDESQPYSETLHFEKDGQPVKWCLPCIALFGKIAPKRTRCVKEFT